MPSTPTPPLVVPDTPGQPVPETPVPKASLPITPVPLAMFEPRIAGKGSLARLVLLVTTSTAVLVLPSTNSFELLHWTKVPMLTLPSVETTMPFSEEGGPPTGPATNLSVVPSNRRSALPVLKMFDMPDSALGEPNWTAPPLACVTRTAPNTSSVMPGRGDMLMPRVLVPMST